MTAPVGVRLLGPIEVTTAAGPTAVAGRKLQALLAMLALRVPGPVSDDRLLDAVWGDEPPTKPVNALQAQISQLRRVLGADVVARVDTGYALRLRPDAVDALELERLVVEGRTAEAGGDHGGAAACFGGAIGLVRGPPLDALDDLPFARDERSRLSELVVSAHEGLIDAELADGRHAEVVDVVGPLVREHPLRERFHAQLMVALYRSGRQSEALRAYQRARETLAEEVGVEPGPELRALERAILAQDPDLAAPISLSPERSQVPMPTPLSSFVPRPVELGATLAALGAARLVTLVGPAGAGKTRLALEVARWLVSAPEQWFIDLAPLGHGSPGEAVAEAVASAVGAPDRSRDGPVPPLERVADRLGERPVLLVLDNCEHVVGPTADLVAALLAVCPRLLVLATSREPMGVDGEHQIAVGGMSDGEAAALFAERAAAVAAPPTDDAERTTAVVDLCRHLDGLPLAIELAAARTKTLAVWEITARLHRRFEMLADLKGEGTAGGRAGGVSRRHGLRAAIDWSHDLLFEDERRVFRRFGVFAGGATTDAVEAVCGPDAFDVLPRLVDKSMLVADTAGPVSRFRMLESLRAYALDRLDDAGDRADAEAAHRAWCVALAEAADRGVRTTDQIVWLDRLDEEHDNLRAAVASAVADAPDEGLRLVAAIILPWWFRARGTEAREAVEACLAAADDPDPAVLAKALTWTGLLADVGRGSERPGGFEHELEVAAARQRRAEELYEAIGDERGVANARYQRALTLTRRGLASREVDRAEIRSLLDGALRVFEPERADFDCGLIRTIEAMGQLAAGDAERARSTAARAREHGAACGDRFAQGRAEWIEGLLAISDGDADAAYRHIERGLRFLDELGLGAEVTVHAGLLSNLAERRGAHALAAQWQAFAAGRGTGLARHGVLVMAAATNAEGIRARAAGDLDRAEAAHRQALEAYTEANVKGSIAFTSSCLGFLATERGDVAASREHHRTARRVAEVAGEPGGLALALEGLAAVSTDMVSAAELLGAAEALWGDSAVEPSHRSDVDAVAARVREALGPAAFDAARARGALEREAALARVG